MLCLCVRNGFAERIANIRRKVLRETTVCAQNGQHFCFLKDLMAFLFTNSIRRIVYLIILYSATHYFLRWKSYSISPKAFRQAATPIQDSNGLSNVNKLRSELRKVYGQRIIDVEWEAMHGGSFDLRTSMLFVAPTEFIAVFHAPYKTSGFSGWHWMNCTCTVLNGQLTRIAYSKHGGNKEKYALGSNFRHGEFETYTYELADDTYLACYGRGAVPLSSLWIATGSIGKADPVSFFKLSYVYLYNSFNEISLAASKTFQYYKSKAAAKMEL